MKQDIRLGTFDGIEVGLNWSVVVILALFAWELAAYVLPARPGHVSAADWIAGVLGAVVLLMSVLAHEFAHAVVARRNDVKVRSVTLFVFGGIAQLEGEAHTPGADFRIAAVGPATSAALAGMFGAMQAILVAAGVHGLPVAVLSWLWQINLLLAIFNLIPGAPLDGGRILRAGLWRRWGDRIRASVAAAHAGRGVGGVLIVLGALAFVGTGNVVGLWPALIGFFVFTAAGAEERYTRVQEAMETLTAAEVMTDRPLTVLSGAPVTGVADYLWQNRADVAAMTDDMGQLIGVVTAQAVHAALGERRRAETAADIVVPLSAIPIARADEPMGTLLDRIMSSGGNPALVLDADGRQLLGIVTTADIERAVNFGIAGRQPQRAGGSQSAVDGGPEIL
jgi:Zn-dependent protease/predicted transcriptional regulator